MLSSAHPNIFDYYNSEELRNFLRRGVSLEITSEMASEAIALRQRG